MVQTALATRRSHQPRSLAVPATLLGLGFGGLADGIVLHQILQWHHMLTSTGGHPTTTVQGLKANTLADGFFHAATFGLAVAGVIMLWKVIGGAHVHYRGREVLGRVLAGWGMFNLVEGVVNHHVLTIHHVREDVGNVITWDLGFLIFGAFLLVVGLVMGRTGETPEPGE